MWTGQTRVTSSQAIVTNSQAVHESWLVRCSLMLLDLVVRNLQFSYYFCNFVNIFAIQLIFLLSKEFCISQQPYRLECLKTVYLSIHFFFYKKIQLCTEGDLECSRTSMMEHFWEYSKHLLSINYSRKNTPSLKFDSILNTPLMKVVKSQIQNHFPSKLKKLSPNNKNLN